MGRSSTSVLAKTALRLKFLEGNDSARRAGLDRRELEAQYSEPARLCLSVDLLGCSYSPNWPSHESDSDLSQRRASQRL